MSNDPESGSGSYGEPDPGKGSAGPEGGSYDLSTEVFDRAGAPRLVLISCGGPFDRARRSYRDNVVVYGVPHLAS